MGQNARKLRREVRVSRAEQTSFEFLDGPVPQPAGTIPRLARTPANRIERAVVSDEEVELLRQTLEQMPESDAEDDRWETLWRNVHRLRRHIALQNPLAQAGPIVFVKQPTASFSHQLTQYLGKHARPGGGVFVLDAPGRTMYCRQLAAGALDGQPERARPLGHEAVDPGGAAPQAPERDRLAVEEADRSEGAWLGLHGAIVR